MCSIEREPRRQDHTICTAVAPEAVFVVRRKDTSTAYGPALVFKFQGIRTQNSRSTVRSHARTRHVRQVRAIKRFDKTSMS
jgi:hypothetical protein